MILEGRIAIFPLALAALVWAGPALAAEHGQGSSVSLPVTLITEGAVPGTEAEASFGVAESGAERSWGLGLSSLQYSPTPWLGLKLSVPAAVIDPGDSGPTMGGLSDLGLMLKFAPVLLPGPRLAVAGGVSLTFPTGSERRGLGGQLAVAPFLAAGKGFGAWSVQADMSYRWQLNRPRTLEPDEEGGEPVRPHKAHGVTSSLAVTHSPLDWLTLILELNTATQLHRDAPWRERVQVYLTPGLGVEPAEGWNVRAGVHVPVTTAKEVDWSALLIVTRAF